VRARSGFTLVEVLIAVGIFTVLMLAVTQSLVPLFKATQKTQTQLQTNREAQTLLERIRADWENDEHYRKSCVGFSLPTNARVQVYKLDKKLRPLGDPHALRTDCDAASEEPAVIKRVIVEVQGSRRGTKTQLFVDIPEP